MQRFYGGDTDWLAVPFKIINAYIVMMPIIQAEEVLTQINVAACGSGNAKVSEIKRIVSEYQKQADSLSVKKLSPLDTEARLMRLSAMGIGVLDMRKNKKKKR